MYYVYVLENSEGHFYVGHSEDLRQRLQSHNDTGPNWIRPRSSKPVRIAIMR